MWREKQFTTMWIKYSIWSKGKVPQNFLKCKFDNAIFVSVERYHPNMISVILISRWRWTDNTVYVSPKDSKPDNKPPAPQHRPLLLPTVNDMSAFVDDNQASQTVVWFGLPVVLVSQQQPAAWM